MEQRKLIKLGNSSFAIALPKDWIDKSGLKKGDNIFLERNSNGELIVSSSFKKGSLGKEVVLRVDHGEEEIARDMISAYVAGYETISVNGEKDKLKMAKEKAKKFVNLEVVEENEKGVIFKDLLDCREINIHNFIKRMDNNLKEMFALLLKIIDDKKNAKTNLKELSLIDDDINKFYFLVWRVMNMALDNPSMQTNLKLNSKSFVLFFWIAYNLEQIGDDLKRIARSLDKVNDGKNVLKETIKATQEVYERSMKSFFEKDKNLAREIILKKPEIIKKCNKLSEFKDMGALCEKLQRINAGVHNNSKMIFYDL